ncbi:BTAD domain-containing putative transcriptional regulator [Nakamurella sp.]|uniref:BTAD domain-containing putative transcriptional regulator n=1 Tax=Nakamurella sp. TaxID=1869182 RepID=UPI003783D83E
MTPADRNDQAPALDVRLLGPLELLVDGVALPLPGGKPRALLASLLISRNRVVPADSLADAIWDGDVPGNFLGTMQVHVSTLRRALRPLSDAGLLTVATQSPGYRAVVDDALVDQGRFGRWVRAGNDLLAAHRYAEAAERLRAALAEWTGAALADLRGFRFADDFAAAVEEDRLVALQSRIDADLASGNESAVIGELVTLTGQYPLREPFWIQLIIALYRSGRQADALEAARRIRQLLDDELGIDPSPALREIEQKVLRQESLGPAGPPAPSSTSNQRTVAETAIVLSHARVRLPSGETLPVPSRGLRLGRMEDNDLVVAGERVSRYHAVVAETTNGFTVTDLRSTNGTHVNDERVVDSHLLHDGDRIRVGRTEIVFLLDA